jgi:PIN domain nuclease of toxin-antitoxin system
VLVSAASLLEIAIKTKIGKPDTQRTPTEIAQEMKDTLAIELLPVLPDHLDAYALIPLYDDHRDPFDRLLIARALSEELTLILDDSKFERYTSLITLAK